MRSNELHERFNIGTARDRAQLRTHRHHFANHPYSTHLIRSSIIFTLRVSFKVVLPYRHSSSIVHRVMRFRHDGPIIRSDTCALLLQSDQSWFVQEKCRDAGGHICGTDSKQSSGIRGGCLRALIVDRER